MIHNVDKTLEAILRYELGKTFGDVNISLAPPDSNFSYDIPTINLFLYDVQERTELRGLGEVRREDDNGFYQKPSPVWLDCFYFLTAWIKEDSLSSEPFKSSKGINTYSAEHWLLTEAMITLVRYTEIPQEFCQGDLANKIPPDLNNLPEPPKKPDLKALPGILFETKILPQQTPEYLRNEQLRKSSSAVLKAGINYLVTLGVYAHEERKVGEQVQGRIFDVGRKKENEPDFITPKEDRDTLIFKGESQIPEPE